MNKSAKKSSVRKLSINLKNIFESIDVDVESWTCKKRCEVDLMLNWVKSTDTNKVSFVCIMINTDEKCFFFILNDCRLFDCLFDLFKLLISRHRIFFSTFSFFKEAKNAVVALCFEIFTSLTDLYFFLVMFRLMEWTRGQTINVFCQLKKLKRYVSLARSNSQR